MDCKGRLSGFFIFFLLLAVGCVLSVPVFAEPYAWVQFSDGSGDFEGTSNLERWITSYIHHSKSSNSEVGVSSFTWGSNFGLINGFDQNSDAGLNSLDPSNVFVVGDHDPSGGLDNFTDAANDNIENRSNFIDGGSDRITHIKAIALGGQSAIIGSANWTAGGLSSQPNSMMVINHKGVGTAVLNKIKSMWNGNNFVDSLDYQLEHEGPNGESIEVLFYPDVHNNIPEGDLEGVLLREIDRSEESVFYHFNRLFLQPLTDRLVQSSDDGLLVEGVIDSGRFNNQLASELKDKLQNSHTARDWRDVFDEIMHHKTMIFDLERIAFGSPNHTNTAMTRSASDGNQEVMMVIDDFRLARRFVGEHRRMMELLQEDGVGPADSFDKNPPGPVSNLTAENVAGADNQVRVSWDAPSDPGDFSRYYIFADTEPGRIDSQKDLCDFQDSDGDGLICEDPPGSVSGFPSGPTLAEIELGDDDADGSTGEDPWMYPEKQVKADGPGGVTETILSTINYGEELPNNTEIHLAVVAVDQHGNESDARFVGPVQSLPAQTGAIPTFELSFASGESDVAGQESELTVELSNGADAEQDIAEWVLETSTDKEAFRFADEQTAPAGWTVSNNGNRLTFSAGSGSARIAPDEKKVFTVSVTNPSQAGESENLTGRTVDGAGVEIGNLTVGSLTIRDLSDFFGVEEHTVTDGENTIDVFDGTRRLRQTDDTVVLELGTAPETRPVLRYRFDENPGGVGTDNDKTVVADTTDGNPNRYTALIENDGDVADGTEIRYLWEIDGAELSRNGSSFIYEIDNRVSPPTNLSIQAVDDNAVTLDLKEVTDGDFSEYRVYFSTNSPVTTEDDREVVTNQFPEGITVSGLSTGTNYFFAVTAVDKVGNESGLSNEVTAEPGAGVNIQEIVAFNSDRTREARELDGSEAFEVESIKVRVEFNRSPGGPVELFYDVDEDPDGPSGFNNEETRLTSTGSDTLWEVGIPSGDSDFEPGSEFRFIIKAGDNLFHRFGTLDPFKYTFSEALPSVSNLTVADTGGGSVELVWKNVNISNFGEYRIFYRKAPDTPTTSSPSWTVSDDPPLTLQSTDGSTVRFLKPGTEYRFRIAVVGESGKIGPLDSTVGARTGSRDALLFTEISPQTDPRWAELTSRTNDLDLTRFHLTDMDGNTTPITVEKTTLKKNRKAVVWLGSGQTETDVSGDLDGSGFVDIYRSGASAWALADTVDQLVLVDSSGETVDAVVYRQDPQTNFGGQVGNVNSLVSDGHWDTADSEGSLNIYDKSTLSRPGFQARVASVQTGTFRDEQDRDDWSLSATATPGGSNRFLEIENVKVSDRSDSPHHYFSRTIDQDRRDRFDGSRWLKKSRYNLEITFKDDPPSDSGFVLWYDTSVNPVGFEDPSRGDSQFLTSNYDPGSRKLNMTFLLNDSMHGDDINFGLSAIPDPDNPSSLDEAFFDRNGEGYHFSVDNRAPDSPGNLKLADHTENGVMVKWNSPSNPSSDFREYRIYYDTGTVSPSSPFFGRGQIEALSDAKTSIAVLPLPVSSDTWNLRIGAIDDRGNGNEFIDELAEFDEFSDTLAVKRRSPISVRDIILSPRNPGQLDGSERLPGEPVGIRVLFDRETTDPILVWNVNEGDTLPSEDGPASDTAQMTKLANKDYRGSIPAQNNGDLVKFILDTDGGELTNDGTGYRYTVDTDATPPVNNFQADTIQEFPLQDPSTSLIVQWSALPSSVENFREYRVVFNRGDTVGVGNNFVGPSKASSLRDRRTSATAVHGLDRADTYTLGVYWVDRVGNVSPLSDTFSILTRDAQPIEDPAFDGEFWAKNLDGTEYLRKNDIEIFFEFGMPPARPDDVHLRYSIDGDPSSNDEDVYDTVEMAPIENDPLTYHAVIPESTSMTEGSVVSYFIQQGPWRFLNNTDYFQFLIDESAPPELGNFRVSDEETYALVFWKALASADDFSEYRIRYRAITSSTWNVYDSSDVDGLSDYRTGSASISGLDPEKNYYVDITAVDKMGRVAYQRDPARLQRSENFLPGVDVSPDRIVRLYPGEEHNLEITVENLDGEPWAGVDIRFTREHGPVGIMNNDGDEINTQTDANGRISVELKAGQTENRFTFYRLEFPDHSWMKDEEIVLFTVPEGEDKQEYGISYSGFE